MAVARPTLSSVTMVAILAAYGSLALQDLRLPGLYYDELIQVVPALDVVRGGLWSSVNWIPSAQTSIVGHQLPLMTMERINRNEDMRRLRELVRGHDVKQIVVGSPLRLDGTRGEMAEEAERFAQRVRKQIGVPVEMVDERLTSWEAERLLEEVQGRFIRHEKLTGSNKRQNVQAKMTVDAVAAAVILKEYLDRQGQTAEKA